MKYTVAVLLLALLCFWMVTGRFFTSLIIVMVIGLLAGCAPIQVQPPVVQYRCAYGQVWRFNAGLWIAVERHGFPVRCFSMV